MIKVARELDVGRSHPLTVLDDVEPHYQKGVWALILDEDAYCVIHVPSGMVVPNYKEGGQHFHSYGDAVALVDRFYEVVPNIASTATPGIMPPELSPKAADYDMLLSLIQQ